MLEKRYTGGGGNRLSRPQVRPAITLRRSLALGDVLCATVVSDKLTQRGFDVTFQAHQAAHPILRRCRNIVGFTPPGGQPDVNLDRAYEDDPDRRFKHFHRMFVDRANQQLLHTGFTLGEPTNCKPRLYVSDSEREIARAKFADLPRPWVFICPRSETYPHRQVPDVTWQEIAARVPGTKFWLGLHPAPAGIVDLKCTHFDTLMVWLSAADLLITVDTGPMHVAAALGVPVVAVSQSSLPDQHLNDQNDYVAVATDLECLNCQKNLCPINPVTPPCFEPEAMILSYSGHKRIGDAVVGERVWSGKKWRRITEVMKTPYNGEGIEIVPTYGRGNPIRVTTEHPFWVRQKGWVKAKDLAVSDYLKMSLPFGPEGAYFTHAKTGKPFMESADDWWTLGYFLGDGWVSGKRVSFAVSRKDEARILPKIMRSIRVLRKPGTAISCSTFEARNKTWSEVFSELGHKAHGKKLPSWIIDARPLFLRALVKGYLDSDGYRLGKELKFTSTSKALLLGFQLIFWKLRYRASITFFKRPPTCVIQGRTVNQRSTYSLSASPHLMISKRHRQFSRKYYLDRKQPYVKIKSISPCVLGPFVYNLTVENDHTYTVNNIYNHNCQRVNVGGIVNWANARLRGRATESVSAVIAIYQPDVEVLNRCLAAVLPQVNEIVVTRAADGIVPRGTMRHPKILYVQAPGSKIGYGKNLNYGARWSNGKYLLLLNDDVFLEPDAVKLLLAQMRPGVGLVSHLLRYPDGKIYHAGVFRKPGDRDWGHIDHGAWHPTFKEPVELENVCGTSVLVRRQTHFEIGGFDEDFFLYSEDNDYAMRVRLHGWKIMFTPHARGIHVGHLSSNKLGDVHGFIKKSNELFHQKWGDFLRHNLNNNMGNFDYLKVA